MTFHGLAELILKQSETPLSANEIWHRAVNQGLEEKLNSTGKTPWATLAARLYTIVKDQPENVFATVGTRPKRFYLKNKTYQVDFEDFEQGLVEEDLSEAPAERSYLEKDLHPFLAYYAYQQMDFCQTKTIDHSTSTKKEFGEWVHPDMVGCIFPIDQWADEVLSLSNQMGNVSIKLLSFELKRSLSLSNLRESFFQTVSNSTWANEAYLVAAEISKDESFRSELQRLSTSFGVGIIEIDIESPDSSQVLYPAKERDNLDWGAINKLASMNKDFQAFLKRVKNDMHTGEIRKERYDRVLGEEELIQLID